MNYFGAPERPKQIGGSQQGPSGPTKRGPCLAQPRQVRSLKMMKYHFFRRLRPCSGTTRHTSAKTKVRGFGAQCEMSLLEWGGESPPRDENFLRGGRGGLGRSVLCPRACVRACLQQGVPLKNRLFPEIRCSFSSCGGAKCPVQPDKVVTEKMQYQIFPRTPL